LLLTNTEKIPTNRVDLVQRGHYRDSAMHRSRDICTPISQIVVKNFIKINIIIKECPEESLIKLAIVLKISKSS
jgi:hypothetical protein